MEKAVKKSSVPKCFVIDDYHYYNDRDAEAGEFGLEYHMKDSLSQGGEVHYHAGEGGVWVEIPMDELLSEAEAGPSEVLPGVPRKPYLSEIFEEEEVDGEEDEIPIYISLGVDGDLWRKPKKRALRLLSSALRDAHDMFGHADDLIPRHERGCVRRGDLREKMADGKVNPSIKKEDLSKQDFQIHNRDAAKKIQLCEETVTFVPQDHETMQAEASWIMNELNRSIFWQDVATPGIKREGIFHILEMLHLKKIEIPFLATYGKEPCLSQLNGPSLDATLREVTGPELKWHQLVWVVHTLDKEWVSLQRRKSGLQSRYAMLPSGQASPDPSKVKISRSLFDMLVHADSENAIDDVDLKFRFHFSVEGEDMVEKHFQKAPSQKRILEELYNNAPRRRRPSYHICRTSGLGDVARMFGHLDLEAGGEEALLHFHETPEEAALWFVCEEFKTPKGVLKGARHMAAAEISFEPTIRQFVRERYLDHDVLNIRSKREERLGGILYSLRAVAKVDCWLDRELPASELCNVQWLLIRRAEEDKLVEVTFGGPTDSAQLEQDLYEKCFGSHSVVCGCAPLWNEQRKLIVKRVLECFLFPSMECEVRSRLEARAKGWYLLHGERIVVGDI